jgi:hypothetical protein
MKIRSNHFHTEWYYLEIEKRKKKSNFIKYENKIKPFSHRMILFGNRKKEKSSKIK